MSKNLCARNSLRLKIIAALVLAAGPVESAAASTWYVDAANGRPSNPGTSSQPFQTAYNAMAVVQPGDTIYFLPTAVYPQLNVTVSGTAGHPITIAGAGSSRSLTKVSGGNSNFAIWINADYVNIQNFDASTTGPNGPILLNQNHHHVTISNNVIHDGGGDGISTFGDDYVTISHNTVYGNAWYTGAGIFGSGISMLGNLDIDSSTGVKMIVDSNVVYANTNTPSPSCNTQQCLSTWSDSDGSGIIVDSSQRQTWENTVYHGRTQISNNVVYGNGGRGIYVYYSDHVNIVDNSVYSNNQDPYEGSYKPGEVGVQFSGDVAVYNNILYSPGGSGPSGGGYKSPYQAISFLYCTDGRGPLIAQYNLMWNPQNAIGQEAFVDPTTTNPVTISSNYWMNPMFKTASLNPSVANFDISPSSPALRRANTSTSMPTDITGASRVAPATIGAYQR